MKGLSSFTWGDIMFTIIYIEVILKNVIACRLFREILLELSAPQDGLLSGKAYSGEMQFAPMSRVFASETVTTESESGTDGDDNYSASVVV